MKTIPKEFFGAHIDVLPTLAELAGVQVPDTLDIHGRSLVPWLKDENAAWEDRYFFTHQVVRKFDTIPGAVRNHQFVLTLKPSDTAFYDLLKDPFQKQDISEQYPEKVIDFITRYRHWYLQATSKGVIPELIQLGHEKISEVILPAQEGVMYGGLSYQGDGWANDWLIHWKDPADSAVWTVNAIEQNSYSLVLSGSASSSANFTVAIDEKIFPIEIKSAMQAPVIPNRDKFPRTEVEEKSWSEIATLDVEIDKGIHTIKLFPSDVSGNVELKAIHFKRKVN